MFAWTVSDMSGVPREVIEHHLAVCPNTCPVKQKARKQAPEKQAFIIKEVEKLKAADIIREVAHPTWLSNGVVVPKPNGGGRLCIDYTDVNKACPQGFFHHAKNRSDRGLHSWLRPPLLSRRLLWLPPDQDG